MTLLNTLYKIIVITVLTVYTVACDETPQTPDSSTIDRQSLNYAYFVNDLTDPENGIAPQHQNISELFALSCGASTCHGVGGGNGGTFKIYGLPLDDAKNISNFISAQGQVIKGAEDTAPTVITNNYPLAHTSPLLNKALSESKGGTTHKGGGVFAQRSESTNNAGGNDYGEVYRWIAFTP